MQWKIIDAYVTFISSVIAALVDIPTPIYDLTNATCDCWKRKFLKIYLRNSTGEERLNGLAMMFIHESVSVSEEDVLDELSLKRRKLNILL